MDQDERISKEKKYPFKTSRLYVNIATTFLAFFMAAVLLAEPTLFLIFLGLTSLVTVALFVLKIRPVINVQRPHQQASPAESLSRRKFYLLVAAFAAIILLPFLLFLSAGSLDIYSWFIILAGVAAGMGISEIVFYIYCTRML
ncbi:MAG TPA: hypothetical protein VJ249_02580 [Candidatus Bathyarchaeia archaeon]|nr:hypothetical protein [Candidatus Bathyarchaeia archaeon]